MLNYFSPFSPRFNKFEFQKKYLLKHFLQWYDTYDSIFSLMIKLNEGFRGGGGLGGVPDSIFSLHTSYNQGQNRLHPKFYRLMPSGIALQVSDGWWVFIFRPLVELNKNFLSFKHQTNNKLSKFVTTTFSLNCMLTII